MGRNPKRRLPPRARLLLVVDAFGTEILAVRGFAFRFDSRNLAVTGDFSGYLRDLFPALLERSFDFPRTDSLEGNGIGTGGPDPVMAVSFPS